MLTTETEVISYQLSACPDLEILNRKADYIHYLSLKLCSDLTNIEFFILRFLF